MPLGRCCSNTFLGTTVTQKLVPFDPTVLSTLIIHTCSSPCTTCHCYKMSIGGGGGGVATVSSCIHSDDIIIRVGFHTKVYCVGITEGRNL
jgi:hypothetical protein